MSVSVSIIVPCYNVAAYLDQCMESLTGQSMKDIEIICVNDGSSDCTAEILREWRNGICSSAWLLRPRRKKRT